jgi:hypothetical protein|tara:strand:+ start:3745 stop:4128 length:384 start_codon:yes stop_codon:yes gene_type:complete
LRRSKFGKKKKEKRREKMLTRRQFFARMKKLGFSKSRMQMTRIGLTYEKEEGSDRVTVTVPKNHSSTFHILGDVPYSGIFHEAIADRAVHWGVSVSPQDLGLNNMLEVCLGLLSGEIEMQKRAEEVV